MKRYLDTSVVIAALVESHPHHSAAFAAVRSSSRTTLATSTHGLAETWATLTRLPLAVPLAPRVALEILDSLEARVTVLPLGRRDYALALGRCSERGLRSGVVFDALHLAAAIRWRAAELLTFNRGDFDRLIAPADSVVIRAPPAPS